MTTLAVYIGLGSNLGDRIEALSTALCKLRTFNGFKLNAVSSLYETSPVKMDSGPFINAVAVIETSLKPRIILEILLDFETAMGRTRSHNVKSSRFIDLDLLLCGNMTVKEKNLVLPHPRMLSRRFVLEPLAELAPDLIIPPTGITAANAAEMLANKCPEQKVKRIGRLEEIKESLRFGV